MAPRTVLAALVGFVAAAACALVAAGAVAGADWFLDRTIRQPLPSGRLAFALVAPWGVVLFAVLLEQADRLAQLAWPSADGPNGR